MGKRNRRIRRKIRKIALTDALFSSSPRTFVARRLNLALQRRKIPEEDRVLFVGNNFPSEEELHQRRFIEKL